MDKFEFFSNIKDQLTDAPVEVKRSFNNIVNYFSAPKSPEDITLDNICDLPIGFLKSYFAYIFSNYEVLTYRGKSMSPKLDKKKFTDIVKDLVSDSTSGLSSIKDAYSKYISTNKSDSKSLDRIEFDILHKRDKVPEYEVTSNWKYLMGKIGNASLKIKRFKKVDKNVYCCNLPNGYDLYGYELVDADISKIKPDTQFVAYDYKEGARVITGKDIPSLHDEYGEGPTIYLYRLANTNIPKEPRGKGKARGKGKR